MYFFFLLFRFSVACTARIDMYFYRNVFDRSRSSGLSGYNRNLEVIAHSKFFASTNIPQHQDPQTNKPYTGYRRSMQTHKMSKYVRVGQFSPSRRNILALLHARSTSSPPVSQRRRPQSRSYGATLKEGELCLTSPA